jgi:hypothetical protein
VDITCPVHGAKNRGNAVRVNRGDASTTHPAEREIQAHFDKGLFETMGLDEFAELCGEESLNVIGAELGTGERFANLHFWGTTNGKVAAADLLLACSRLEFLADGSAVDLDELTRLGTLGWDKWSDRAPKQQE